MSCIALTGATGFIGERLLEDLLRHANKVVVLGRRRPSKAGNRVFFVSWDAGREAIPSYVLDGVDVVFHLAGKAHALAETKQDEEEYFRINTKGTERLLVASQKAGVRRFVYFSTVKVLDEDSPYARSKREAERLVLEGGFVPEPVVLRPAMVYGPTTKGNLARMIKAIARGLFPPIPEFGNQRSMVDREDLVQAAWLAATRREAIERAYNVCDGYPYSTRKLYEWICEALGRRPARWHLPAWMLKGAAKIGDLWMAVCGRRFIIDSDAYAKLAGSAWYESEAIRRELGWLPRRNLRDVLPEIILFLRSRGEIA